MEHCRNNNSLQSPKREFFLFVFRVMFVILFGCFFATSLLAQNTNFNTQNGVPVFPWRASDPTPAEAGMMYFNTSDNKLYWYNGTQWIPIGGALSMRPLASDVAVAGPNFKVGSVLTGSYTYVPDAAAGAAEGTSTFKWYVATDDAGTGKTEISGATAQTYTIAAPVVAGNYLAFSVTPVSSMGPVGNETLSSWYKVNPVMADGTEIADVTSSSALTWMDRNLGATQVASSSTDYKAYGSLFQWARAADGHQRITWTSSTAGTAVNGTTTTLSASTTPGHSNFILSSTTPYDWLSTQQADGSLWWSGTATGTNNPCPADYHVPTQAEWQAEITAGITNAAIAYSKLKLVTAGFRGYSGGALGSTGTDGIYWSSSVSGTGSYSFGFNSSASNLYTSYRAYGFSIRCVKNMDKPWAQGVSIASTPTMHANLTGTYTFVANPSTSSAEGTSIYKWYVATDASGTGKTEISGATTTTYTVTAPIAEGNYLAFSVTPVAANGETGTEVISTWQQVMPKASDGTAVVEQTSTSSRVWMDRNLGATRVATASDDYHAYGSLFQWARAADGHEKINWTGSTAGTAVNGTTTTLSATTNPGHSNFIINTASPSDWLSSQQSDGSLWWNETTAGANSPCPTGYHVPTKAEWEAETAQGITSAATAYSKLKLPVAGYRGGTNGLLGSTGIGGGYWSSSVNGARAWYLNFGGGGADVGSNGRASGFSIRCIKNLDAPQAQSISVSGTPTVGAIVTGTYTYLPPQTSGSAEGTSTYKWYKATDAAGTGKTVISGATAQTYTLAAPVVAGNYLAFAVTPVSADGKTGTETLSSWILVQTGGTTVADMTSTSGRVWMDRNLGATQVATSSTDYLGYGSLFQWARAADGHEKITWTNSTTGTVVNGTTTTLSTTTNPGHSLFIMNAASPYDWLSTQQADGSLWWNSTTAVAGTNNPCPTGYHVPTKAEWDVELALFASKGGNNSTGAYAHLKLPMAGNRDYSNGSLGNTGSFGNYWSSSVNGAAAWSLGFTSGSASMSSSYRARGFSVRCVKNVDAPLAESVTVSGTPTVGATVTGAYTYQPPQTGVSAEGTSTFKWYVATDAAGTGKTAISGATTKTYTLVAPVVAGNYLAFAVTPVSSDGKTGAETLSSWILVQTGGTTVVDMTSTSGRVWMDRNLGATQVATSSTDHLAYGSLFQWARAADGHELINWTNSTSGTPANATTTSTRSATTTPGHSQFIIHASSPYDWLSTQQADGSLWWNGTTATAGVNNPCPTGYHVPTKGEWEAEAITNSGTAYSKLKMVMAGYRGYNDGALATVGTYGNYWTSSVSDIRAWHVNFMSTTSTIIANHRAYGFSVRCIKNIDAPQAQSVSVTGAATIGSTLTGTYTYVSPQTGVSAEGTSTYKWYVATDASGTGKTAISGATAKTYTVAAPIIDGNYLAFAVTPVSSDGKTGTETLSSWTLVASNAPDGTVLVELSSPSGRIWMDRNLGATQTASSSTDYLAYGSFYQWCRANDGHERINWTSATAGTPVNGTTAGPIASTSPGNSLFVTNGGGTYDWLSPQQANGNLWWNGTTAGANNPCPTGYHVPTTAEWNTELALFAGNGGTNATGAYNLLKLQKAGYRSSVGGSLTDVNNYGRYQTSSVSGTNSSILYFSNGSAVMDLQARANGASVRCIKSLSTSTPLAQNVSITGSFMAGATVTGNYTYVAPQASGSAEATSTYKWYRATDSSGTGKTVISGATAKTYTIAAPVVTGNYLAFAITPISADGNTGSETLSRWVQVAPLASDGITQIVELGSTSGRVWMDRNMGASQAATSSTDYLAYGSLFQWVRATDGHEKINWTSSATGTPVNGTTPGPIATTSPGNSLFVINSGGTYDWLSTQQANGNLWWSGTAAGANSPCPTGYHVPTKAEWDVELALFASKGGNNATGAYNHLKLPTVGARNGMTGSLFYTGSYGIYWSSSVNGTSSWHLEFLSNNAYMYSGNRAHGVSVRCMKDATVASDGTVLVELASTSGRIWMDRNLGAAQAATSSTDYLAYGSLFQWVRAADGHEKINWTNSTTGTPVNGTTAGPIASTSPGNSLFVTNSTSPYDWLSTQQPNGNLWWSGTTAGANSPCPTGYHVPTKAEWETELALFASKGGNNAIGAFNHLKLSLSGSRFASSGSLDGSGSGGNYWSSSVNGTETSFLYFNTASATMTNSRRASGYSVRCIKNDSPLPPDEITQVVELTSTSGRVWMDRNLGASQAATSSIDYLAYGSLFQWVRAADGHEKINWTNSTTGAPNNAATTSTLSATTTPGHSNFIINTTSPYDWLSTQQANGNLWWSGTAAGANNPCPTGYHVPTKAEWEAEIAQGITNTATAYSKLKLPMAGYRRNNSGSLADTGANGHYWSSSVSDFSTWNLYFMSNGSGVNSNYRAYGFSVRCVKD